MGRLVGDGAVICYIQDLMIHPDYQHYGIGSAIIEDLIEYVENLCEEGTEIMLDLMCAQTIYKLLSKAFFACVLDNGLKLTAFLNSRYVSTPTLFDTSVTNFILSLSSFFYIICFSS